MSKKVTQEDFVQRANAAHNNQYDYSQTVYKGMKIKVKVRCPLHGFWKQRADEHVRGKGCPKCAIENIKGRTPKPAQQFIVEANQVHGEGTYDYSEVVYENGKTKVTIKCPKHGLFKQRPDLHLTSKHGCPKCANKKQTKTAQQFIMEANQVHGEGTYDYSEVVYINNRVKVTIKCPKHDLFKQRPDHHLTRYHGCPKCSNSISKPETRWLDHLGIPEECRQYKIKIGKKTYNVDGYDPKTNTVYELHGDFWHGNPHIHDSEEKNPVSKKTFGELFEATTKRARILKGAGYNVVSVWESDWLEQEKRNK